MRSLLALLAARSRGVKPIRQSAGAVDRDKPTPADRLQAAADRLPSADAESGLLAAMSRSRLVG
jgi:hypothetical protein